MGAPGSPGIPGLNGLMGQKVERSNIHSFLFFPARIIHKFTVFLRVIRERGASTVLMVLKEWKEKRYVNEHWHHLLLCFWHVKQQQNAYPCEETITSRWVNPLDCSLYSHWIQGVAGFPGFPGFKGSAGYPGLNGGKGPAGTPGLRGDTGPKVKHLYHLYLHAVLIKNIIALINWRRKCCG